MGRDAYQAVSPVQSMVFISAVRHYLTTPGLVFTFFPCAVPDFWAPMFAYADLARLASADYEIGGRRYGMFGHNWRATPPTQWLALLAERETGRGADLPRPAPAEPIVVLSEPEFAAAVRDALRDFTRLDALAANPLIQSRLVLDTRRASASYRPRRVRANSFARSTTPTFSPPRLRRKQPNGSTCRLARTTALANRHRPPGRDPLEPGIAGVRLLIGRPSQPNLIQSGS
jgi:hypothetical protein